jgi:LL-diaminopimelate aminotransferase
MSQVQPFAPADRISGFKPYFFASLSQKLNELKSKGVEIIRLDIGSPDLPPKEFIIESLVNSARRSEVHGYSPNGGPLSFRKAIAHYYQNRFEVELDPSLETIALIGSKEGLFNLSQVMINPGDTVLVPDPGYPVYSASGLIAGAKVYTMPILAENHFLPDLDAIPFDVLQKAKILWLNYPNNPTGAVATMEFFEKAILFAKKHHILVAHDAPYVDVCFGGYHAPSILQVTGAKEIAVEFNSLSKTYNMAGWRLGMVVGNKEVINYLNTYKSQMDSSHFAPIFEAGITALCGDQEWIVQRNKIYEKRRNLILTALRSAGIEVDTPPASIYVWSHLPKGQKDSMSFCNTLLEDTGISVTPGIVYGNYGEGFMRFSLGTSTENIEKAMSRFCDWFAKHNS